MFCLLPMKGPACASHASEERHGFERARAPLRCTGGPQQSRFLSCGPCRFASCSLPPLPLARCFSCPAPLLHYTKAHTVLKMGLPLVTQSYSRCISLFVSTSTIQCLANRVPGCQAGARAFVFRSLRHASCCVCFPKHSFRRSMASSQA